MNQITGSIEGRGLRLCIVSHEGELGPQMVQFARRIAKMGSEVHAIIRSYPLQRREFSKGKDGVIRHIAPTLPIRRLMFPSYFLSALILGLAIRCDIVICREPITGLIGLAIKLLTGRKLAIYVVDSSTDLKVERGTWRSKILIKLGRFLERIAISNSDLLIALDHTLVPYLKRMGGRRISVIPYGANVEIFTKGDAGRALKKLGLEGKRLVVYAGSMEAYHGAHYLALAAPIIKKHIENALVIFLGDGPLRRYMEKVAGDSAIFLGTIPYEDLPDIFAASEVAVAPPSPRSPYVSVLTTKIFDYIAAGKAIVATDIGGIGRAFSGAVLLVKPGDHLALAEAIIKVLKDADLRKRLEEGAKRLAEEKFNWDKLSKELVEELLKIL